MNKRFSQQGSAHVVVVICLVLALFTALGWIFYQNFILKEQAKNDTEFVVGNKDKSVNNDQEDTSERKEEKTFKNDKIEFDYPSNWTIESDEDSSTPGFVRLYSPDYVEVKIPQGCGAPDGCPLRVPDTGVSIVISDGVDVTYNNDEHLRRQASGKDTQYQKTLPNTTVDGIKASQRLFVFNTLFRSTSFVYDSKQWQIDLYYPYVKNATVDDTDDKRLPEYNKILESINLK